MDRSVLTILLCFVFASACFVGLGEKEDRADFVLINGAEPETIDPAILTGVIEGRIADNIFEGLTTPDPKDLTPRPGVAERWEISPDGLTYTFHLRKSEWTNGDPVTAHDFVYSWRRALAPETASQYAYMLYPLRNAEAYNSGEIQDPSRIGVRALDDYTLRVELEHPTAYFLQLTYFSTLLPVNRKCVETYGINWTHAENIVTNGPFVVESWEIGRRIRLRKNPRHWDAANIKVETVDLLSIESTNTSFNMYLCGLADFCSTIPTQLRDLVRSRDDYHVGPYIGTTYLLLNVKCPPLDDVRVRKALSMAIDRDQIVKYIMKGGEEPARAFVPTCMPGYTPPKGLDYWRGDFSAMGADERRRCEEESRRVLAQARELLADAGYPNGEGFPRLDVLYPTRAAIKDIAEVLQQMWKKNLGIRVSLLNKEWKVYLASTKEMDYQIAIAGWIGDYADPKTFLDMWVTGGGNNRTGWSNGEYDRLIRLTETTTDPKERMDIFRRAETILVEKELPIVPLFYRVSEEMYRRNVKGIWTNIRNVHPLKYVYVERGADVAGR